MPKDPIDRRTIIIMGATKGIGAALARELYAMGANLALIARSKNDLQKLGSELAGGNPDDCNRLLLRELDITDTPGVQSLFRDANSRFGCIDVLINNAAYNSRGKVADQTAHALGKIVEVNLAAPIKNCRLVLPYLTASQGHIINIASLAGRAPVPKNATYSSTKFGLRAFSTALRQEVRAQGIGVSVISPGPVLTPFVLEDLDNVPDIVFSQKLSTAEDIVAIVIRTLKDRKAERVTGLPSRYLTTLAYLFPGLRGLMESRLEAKGAKVKARLAD